MFVTISFLFLFNIYLYLSQLNFQIQLLVFITSYIFYVINIYMKLALVYSLIIYIVYLNKNEENKNEENKIVNEELYLDKWEKFTKNVLGYYYDDEKIVDNGN